MSEAEGGVSVSYIFRTIMSQKWIALIIAAVITVVGTVGLYFWGKRSEVYTASFVLQLPDSGEVTTTSYTYPDGESFYFTDLISSENLKAVASRDEFKGIDVNKIVKEGDISISREIDRVDDSKEGVYDLNYTIKVKAKYFKSENVARAFIEALTVFPQEHISAMSIDYDDSLTSSRSKLTYEEQLSALKSQTLYIQSKYAELIESHGGEFVVEDGKTLASYKKVIDDYIKTDLFSSLTALANKNGYVKSREAQYKYESKLTEVEEQLNLAVSTRNELREFAKEGSVIYDEIITISREIATLTQQQEYLKKYIESCEGQVEPPEDYTDEVERVESSVTGFTEGLKSVAPQVYGRVTKVIYLSPAIVVVEGGRGIVMSLALSLFAGIVLALVIAFIVGYCRQRVKPASVKAAPPAEETVASDEAAATAEKPDKKDKK